MEFNSGLLAFFLSDGVLLGITIEIFLFIVFDMHLAKIAFSAQA